VALPRPPRHDLQRERRTQPSRNGQTSPRGAGPGSPPSLTSIPGAWSSSTRPVPRPGWPGCRPRPARPALPGGHPARTLQDDDVHRCPAPAWHDRAHGSRRADEPRGVPGLCRAGAGAHPAARRHDHHGQPAVHKGSEVRRAIEAAGASLRCLPPCSPDLNPIENAFSKLEAIRRKAAARTIDILWIRSDVPRRASHFRTALATLPPRGTSHTDRMKLQSLHRVRLGTRSSGS